MSRSRNTRPGHKAARKHVETWSKRPTRYRMATKGFAALKRDTHKAERRERRRMIAVEYGTLIGRVLYIPLGLYAHGDAAAQVAAILDGEYLRDDMDEWMDDETPQDTFDRWESYDVIARMSSVSLQYAPSR